MPGPAELRIKRRRDESAPDTLVVEPDSKRAQTQIRYARDKDAVESPSRRPTGAAIAPRHTQRRIFHLAKSNGVSDKEASTTTSIPIFTEHVSGRGAASANAAAAAQAMPQQTLQTAEAPASGRLKRPGRGSATAPRSRTGRTGAGDAFESSLAPPDHAHFEALAADLHQVGLLELSPQEKPRITAVPKLSGLRSREIHRQRVSAAREDNQANDDAGTVDVPTANDGDTDMDDAREYVIDTYRIVLDQDLAEDQSIFTDNLDSVGYLVITEADQETWDAYLEDSQADKDVDSDDEDENAEDHYGADYPEDELASDDELDHGAYRYRAHGGGSDDEEYDEDTGVYSDDSDDKVEGSGNPLRHKAVLHLTKEMEGKAEG